MEDRIRPIHINNLKAEKGTGLFKIKHRYSVVIVFTLLVTFVVASQVGLIAMLIAPLPALVLGVYSFLVKGKPDFYTRDAVFSLFLTRHFNYKNIEKYRQWLQSDD